MEHPILSAIQRASFTPLGWFEPEAADKIDATFVILIGNAGPQMFRRFARERNPARDKMDEWTREVVSLLATELEARAVFPFDVPPLPFLAWARRAGAGHVSPLGLNIHPQYGLWHAYRAALLFPVVFDLPAHKPAPSPCEACEAKPCLSACPVGAFDGVGYDVKSCGQHLLSGRGDDCMSGGCLARKSCPVGRDFAYETAQLQFHMKAFAEARKLDP